MFCGGRNNMPETELTMLKSDVRFSRYMIQGKLIYPVLWILSIGA